MTVKLTHVAVQATLLAMIATVSGMLPSSRRTKLSRLTAGDEHKSSEAEHGNYADDSMTFASILEKLKEPPKTETCREFCTHPINKIKCWGNRFWKVLNPFRGFSRRYQNKDVVWESKSPDTIGYVIKSILAIMALVLLLVAGFANWSVEAQDVKYVFFVMGYALALSSGCLNMERGSRVDDTKQSITDTNTILNLVTIAFLIALSAIGYAGGNPVFQIIMGCCLVLSYSIKLYVERPPSREMIEHADYKLAKMERLVKMYDYEGRIWLQTDEGKWENSVTGKIRDDPPNEYAGDYTGKGGSNVSVQEDATEPQNRDDEKRAHPQPTDSSADSQPKAAMLVVPARLRDAAKAKHSKGLNT